MLLPPCQAPAKGKGLESGGDLGLETSFLTKFLQRTVGLQLWNPPGLEGEHPAACEALNLGLFMLQLHPEAGGFSSLLSWKAEGMKPVVKKPDFFAVCFSTL